MNLKKNGSLTARNGFKNEDDIIKKFNNWKKDLDAQKWLTIMEYSLNEIKSVEAVKISGFKTDVQIQVTIKLIKEIDTQNLQIKLVSNPKGFNQIDKRWLDKYSELWKIPKNILEILKKYTGENKPNIAKPRDKRRMFMNEFSKKEQNSVIAWIEKNKILILNDIIKGRGKFAAEWMLVAQKINKNAKWILKPINYCINFFGQGEVMITEKGNIRIGKITMQRKGGDGGRQTANMLQFKINPCELFN